MTKLAQQSSIDWLRMAMGSLVGACQMALRLPTEVTDNITLFARMTGRLPLPEPMWRISVTWAAAVLLALSVEQSLKTVAIEASESRECRKTHDLEQLWDDIPAEDREGIVQSAQRISGNLRGTRFDQIPCPTSVTEMAEVVRHHRDTFEHTRYHLETRPGVAQRNLTRNHELWLLALGALEHARTKVLRGLGVMQ